MPLHGSTSTQAATWPRRALVAVLATATTLALLLGVAPQRADAGTLRGKAVALAAQQDGKPYASGSAGPTAFDCSGLVSYVWTTRLRRALPRTATDQYRAVRHVSRKRARPGDLVFFGDPEKRMYHVGIYAGDGTMWHAPKPGDTVRLATIWTTDWYAGRVA